MLIPVRTISRWPARERPPDVGEDDLRGEAPLRAASRRDDAVRAEERAAVLDLDERPGPLDRCPLVGDPLDLDAGQGRQRPADERRPARAAGRARAGPSSASSSARSASFERLSTSRAPGSAAANAARPTWTEQPVTTIAASGLARRARRTAWRDFASASAVTVQVLTRTRSAGRSPSTIGDPALAEAPRGAFHLGLVDLAAEVRDRGGPDRPRGPAVAERRDHVRRSPQLRLRAHQEADRPDERGHRVAHVALALRPLEPDPVVGGGADPDQPAQVRPLDEEREDEVRGVDRERDEQPRLAEQRAAEGQDERRSRSAPARSRRRASRGPASRAGTGRARSGSRRPRAASGGRTAAGSTAGTG